MPRLCGDGFGHAFQRFAEGNRRDGSRFGPDGIARGDGPQRSRARIEGQRHIRKAADDEALLEVLAAVREIQQQGRAPAVLPAQPDAPPPEPVFFGIAHAEH